MSIKQFAALAMKNRAYLAAGEVGCYYCISIYDVTEIKEWTDNGETAICPKCGVDAVISKIQHELNADILKEAKKYWFNNNGDSSLQTNPNIS